MKSTTRTTKIKRLAWAAFTLLTMWSLQMSFPQTTRAQSGISTSDKIKRHKKVFNRDCGQLKAGNPLEILVNQTPGWTADAIIDEYHGLSLYNIGACYPTYYDYRYMAYMFQIPYICYQTNKQDSNATPHRVPLCRLNATDTGETCRLVSFSQKQGSVVAEWAIENLPRYDIFGNISDWSPNCLKISVSYAFNGRDNRTAIIQNHVGGQLPAYELTPTVQYQFMNSKDKSEKLLGIWVPLQMNVKVDGFVRPQSTDIFRDCEAWENGSETEPCIQPDIVTTYKVDAAPPIIRSPVPGVAVKNFVSNASDAGYGNAINSDGTLHFGGNPAAWPYDPAHIAHSSNLTPQPWAWPDTREIMEDAVTNRTGYEAYDLNPPVAGADLVRWKYPKRGDWDNIHQTCARQIDLPVPVPPGCPECFHYHWRWFADAGPHWGSGSPMVYYASQSTQTMQVALTDSGSTLDNAIATGGNFGESYDHFSFTWHRPSAVHILGQNQAPPVWWLLAQDYGRTYPHVIPQKQVLFPYRGVFFAPDGWNDSPYNGWVSMPPMPGGGIGDFGEDEGMAQDSTNADSYTTAPCFVGESKTYQFSFKNAHMRVHKTGDGAEQPLVQVVATIPPNSEVAGWSLPSSFDVKRSEDGTQLIATLREGETAGDFTGSVNLRYISEMESGSPSHVDFQVITPSADKGDSGRYFLRYNTTVK